MRFIVEQVLTGVIQSRDLEVLAPEVTLNLSGPCSISGTIPLGSDSAEGIDFAAYAQYIHVEEVINNQRTIIATGILQPTQMDEVGNLLFTALGFTSYADGMPWLDTYSPTSVDPFDIVKRIWNHLQTQPNGNLGVTLTPASSGTTLVAAGGYTFLWWSYTPKVMEVKPEDKLDCGEQMNKWARDVPFDYEERSSWNSDRTVISKSIHMSYPRRGSQKDNISFRLGENVISGTPREEIENEFASAVYVEGWLPGVRVIGYSNNPIPNRLRRVLDVDDAAVTTQERADSWASKLIKRRQTPKSWAEIEIDLYHPSAPFGSWDLGDDILIQGYMPWVGMTSVWHRVMAYTPDFAAGRATLALSPSSGFEYTRMA